MDPDSAQDPAFQVDPDPGPRGLFTVSHQRSVSILSRKSVLWIRIQHFKRIRIRAPGGLPLSPARGQSASSVGNQCCGSGSSNSSGSGSAPPGGHSLSPARGQSASSVGNQCCGSGSSIKWIRIRIRAPGGRPLSTARGQTASSVPRESALWIRIRIRVQHFKGIRIRAPGGRSLSPARG